MTPMIFVEIFIFLCMFDTCSRSRKYICNCIVYVIKYVLYFEIGIHIQLLLMRISLNYYVTAVKKMKCIEYRLKLLACIAFLYKRAYLVFLFKVN
jgi:hypothetical protein